LNWADYRLECHKELGYALVYMDYLYPDLDWGDQYARVKALCERYAENSGNTDPGYWREFLREIRDEIENMC